MIIYLTNEEKQELKQRKYTDQDIQQVENGLNKVEIINYDTNRKTSRARVLKEIGRAAYINRVDRAAFHGSSSYEEKYYFNLRFLFR